MAVDLKLTAINILPASRQRPNGRGIAGNPQRISRSEGSAITRAGLPPVSGSVDNCFQNNDMSAFPHVELYVLG